MDLFDYTCFLSRNSLLETVSEWVEKDLHEEDYALQKLNYWKPVKLSNAWWNKTLEVQSMNFEESKGCLRNWLDSPGSYLSNAPHCAWYVSARLMNIWSYSPPLLICEFLGDGSMNLSYLTWRATMSMVPTAFTCMKIPTFNFMTFSSTVAAYKDIILTTLLSFNEGFNFTFY